MGVCRAHAKYVDDVWVVKPGQGPLCKRRRASSGHQANAVNNTFMRATVFIRRGPEAPHVAATFDVETQSVIEEVER